MKFTLRHGELLCAAAFLALPGAAFAQDNATATNSGTEVATNAIADPALNDPMAADAAATDPFNTTAPIEGTLANDIALANSIEPERDDKDFPWGLLGLLGLAGLLGRKRNNDVHLDTSRDTPR